MKQTVKLRNADKVIRLPFAFCIKCGQQTQTQAVKFDENENNSVAQFSKLAGDVSIIFEFLLNKNHKVEAPLCKGCFERFRTVDRRRQISYLLGLVALFVGIVVSTLIHEYVGIPGSIIPAGIGIASLITARIYGRYFAWLNSPNITEVTKKQIVLKVPGRGKITCVR